MKATAKIETPLSRWRGVRQWRVAITDASGAARSFQVIAGASLKVGAHPANEIALQDDTVSRMHAELTGTPDGIRVRDVGSTNGCWYQGARLFDSIVSAGSVKVGEGSTLIISAAEAAMEPLAPVDHYGPLIGRSPPMRSLFKSLSSLVSSQSTVLIQGESGTGKELVARAIHDASPRRSKPYVIFDCASVAPTLIESALFGHERGSFTGATSRSLGCFEEADGGTLFLDEIGELPLELQPRLLRAIESREIRRVGANKPISVDVRVIAATHRDLARGVNTGHFREDLFYRLAVLSLRVPPLRERLEDLKGLIHHLMREPLRGDEAAISKALDEVTEAQWQQLRAHPWRGNVRELRNVVERSLATQSPLTPVVELASGVPAPRVSTPSAASAEFNLDLPFLEQKQAVLDRFEQAYLQAMVARHEGNFSRAAAGAGIDRMYFKRLLKKWGLTRP